MLVVRRISVRIASLTSLWYGLLTACLHVAICHRQMAAQQRMLQLPWQRPPAELRAQSALIWLSLVVLVAFLLVCCVRVSCSRRQMAWPWWQMVARGCLPPAPLLHVLMAALLVAARVLVRARLIANGFLSADHIWTSDLDGLIQSLSSSASSQAPPPPLPPPHSAAHLLPVNISVESLHLLLALTSLALAQAGAALWHCTSAATAVFWLQLLANSCQLLCAPASLAALLNVHVYGVLVLRLPAALLLDASSTCTLHALSAALVAVSGGTLHLLGVQRFSAFAATSTAPAPANTGCWRRARLPHCAALCLLLAVGVANAPLLHDTSVLYRRSGQPALLVWLVASLVQLALWLLVWLVLVARPQCGFSVALVAANWSRHQTRHQSRHHETLIQLASGRAAAGAGASRLLVVCRTGVIAVDDAATAEHIVSVARQQKSLDDSARQRRSALKRPVMLPHHDDVEEQRYVQLATSNIRVTENPLDLRSERWNGRRCPRVIFVPSSGDDQEYSSLAVENRVERASMERECEESCQPLLPLRPRAIRSPPEQVYTCRQQMAPPRLRRASSQALPPTLPSSGLQRSLSFRHPSRGGARIEPRVTFNVGSRLDGVGQTTSPVERLNSTTGTAVSAVVHVHSTAADLTTQQQQQTNSTPRPCLWKRQDTLKSLPIPLPSKCSHAAALTAERDSAVFSMSLSSGSDAGSSR